MAEQSTTTNQDQQTGTGQAEQQYTQRQFDSVFGQIAQRQPEVIREAFRAYWDLAEETLRTARRVSEQQALSMAKQELVAEVTGHVIAAIRQNPQFLAGVPTTGQPSSQQR